MKRIELHWGHYIAIFYVCFVIIVIIALVASTKVDRSLVVDDYYAKDLAYQSQYDKITNQLNDDKLSLTHDSDSQKVVFSFSDADQLKGHIQFYRPSDKSQDFILDITQSQFAISTEDLSNGKWKVKVDWENGGTAYL